MNEIEHKPTYLIEGDNAIWRIEAEKVLKKAKLDITCWLWLIRMSIEM